MLVFGFGHTNISREEGLTFAHTSRYSSSWRNQGGRSLKQLLTCHSPTEAENDECVPQLSSPSLHSPGSSAQGMVLPTIETSLLMSVKCNQDDLSLECPQVMFQILLSWKNNTSYHTRVQGQAIFSRLLEVSSEAFLPSPVSRSWAVACLSTFLVPSFLFITPVHIRLLCPVFCLIHPTLLSLILPQFSLQTSIRNGRVIGFP